MELSTTAGQQLVVASDIRNTLFRRALVLLDEVHHGLEEFSLGAGDPGDRPPGTEASHALAVVPVGQNQEADAAQAGALVLHSGADPLERALATLVQGRTNTARRAVDAVAQIHNEIETILSSFEREFPPVPAFNSSKDRFHEITFKGVRGHTSEEVLRMAAATTAAAARFRVRAAEAAKSALQVYDSASKQAAIAAQATTKALELQVMAEQFSMAGNLPQALDAIRQANRLRDESAEAARNSRRLQDEYARHRKEAQEAHAQADAAMRHAYSLERDAIKASTEAATRDHAVCKEQYERLAQQAEGLQAQAAAYDAEADAAAARAEQAQQHADMHMAAGNYELGNALVGEAVRSKEQAGYARAQAAAAREALQRLMPDVNSARERMEEVEQHLQELSQRQAQLQDATAKQRKDRLEEEVAELAALCNAAEGAAAMHEELVRVYEDRLEQDQQQYNALAREGKTAEAEALAVHISTWQELLQVARENRDSSKAEAEGMRARLAELSKVDVAEPTTTDDDEPPKEFRQLRVAKDREERATHAAAILVRELTSVSVPDSTLEVAGTGNDGLLLQTELHHQRIARLAEQMHRERERLGDGGPASSGGEGRPDPTQTESLLDSMAVSHLVGTLETTRLLQLWKQRSEQAAASANEMRETWVALEREATAKADEAVRLEEQALALEQAGCSDEAAATMAQAEELHRLAEQLRVQADKARAVLLVREKAAGDAQTQSRFLVQGLHDVEHAAERLQAELGLRGYILEAQQEAGVQAPAQAAADTVSAVDSGRVSALSAVPSALPHLEGPSITQDELATVMMASPSLLSRSSSFVAVNVSIDTTGTTRLQDTVPAGHEQGGSMQDALAVLPSTGPWVLDGRQAPAAEDGYAQSLQPSASGRSFGTDMLAGAGSVGDRDARLARLLQELEMQKATEALAMPSFRWDGYSDLMLAIQSGSAVDETALASAASGCSTLLEQVRERAGAAELQRQQDEARLSRLQELVAGLPPDVDPEVRYAAESAVDRCAAVTAASRLAEEALTLQASTHDALALRVGSYRQALSTHAAARETALSAQAEVVAAQQHAQEARQVEMELAQQVQQLEARIEVFEAEGSTGQALAARFELGRLQNKHAEAAAESRQLFAVYEAAQQWAEDADEKLARATANLEAARNAVLTLADAAHEAGGAAEHALDGYGLAVSALTLGAQAGLGRIRMDGSVDVGALEAGAQQHLGSVADRTAHAQHCLAASKRLQEALDTLLGTEKSATSQPEQLGSGHAHQFDRYSSASQLAGTRSGGPAETLTGLAPEGSGTVSARSLQSAPSGLSAPSGVAQGLQSPQPSAASSLGGGSFSMQHGAVGLRATAFGGPLDPSLSASSIGATSAQRDAAGTQQAVLGLTPSAEQASLAGIPQTHGSALQSVASGLSHRSLPSQQGAMSGPQASGQLAWPMSDKLRHGSLAAAASGEPPASYSSVPVQLGALRPPSAGGAQLAWNLSGSLRDGPSVVHGPLQAGDSEGLIAGGRFAAHNQTPGYPLELDHQRREEGWRMRGPGEQGPGGAASQHRLTVSPASDSVQLGAFSSIQSSGIPGLQGFPSAYQGTLSSSPASGPSASAVSAGALLTPSAAHASAPPSWTEAVPAGQQAQHKGLPSAPPSGESAASGAFTAPYGSLSSGLSARVLMPHPASSAQLGGLQSMPSSNATGLQGPSSSSSAANPLILPSTRLASAPSGSASALFQAQAAEPSGLSPSLSSTVAGAASEQLGPSSSAPSSGLTGLASASSTQRVLLPFSSQSRPSVIQGGVSATQQGPQSATASGSRLNAASVPQGWPLSAQPSATSSQGITLSQLGPFPSTMSGSVANSRGALQQQELLPGPSTALSGPQSSAGQHSGLPSSLSGASPNTLPASTSGQHVFSLPFGNVKAAQQALGRSSLSTTSSLPGVHGEDPTPPGSALSPRATGAGGGIGARGPGLGSVASGVPSSVFPSGPSWRQSGNTAVSTLKDDYDYGYGFSSGTMGGSQPSAAHHPVLAALPPDSAQAMLAIEAEIEGLYTRYQQQQESRRSPRQGQGSAEGAKEEQRLVAQRELAAQLHEAQEQLRAVRVQQEYLRDSSPAEVQASHDRVQFHEQRVAMLQQALLACDELATSRSAVDRTREAINAVDLEAQQYDETLSLLDKAAELCGAATRELQLQSLDVRDQVDAGVQQRLAVVQDKAAEIARRRLQIQRDAEAARSRRQQLAEQLVAEQSAVQLREDWLQQTRKAVAATTATMSWEERVNAARVELSELEAPFNALKDKAAAAANLAETMNTTAAQHRKQAGDLARQAAEQREDARRLAASGRHLEAEAAKAMGDRLQQQADGLLAQAEKMEVDAGAFTAEAHELGQAAEDARRRAAAQAQVLEQVSEAHRLAVSAMQLNRTAACKLQDATQKQAMCAQQQLELSEVEKNLTSMEAQVSGSGGGGALRPDELAAQMINVVRAKQQAAQMRAALRAAQEQLDQDKDAAAAAVRQAGKAEGQCAQLAPRIQELEQQAQASSTAAPGHDQTHGQSIAGRTSGVAGGDGALGRHGGGDVAQAEASTSLPISSTHTLSTALRSAEQLLGSTPSLSTRAETLPFGLSMVLSTLDSDPAHNHSSGQATDLSRNLRDGSLGLSTATLASSGARGSAPRALVLGQGQASGQAAGEPAHRLGSHHHEEGPALSPRGSPQGGSRTASATTLQGSSGEARALSGGQVQVGDLELARSRAVMSPVAQLRLGDRSQASLAGAAGGRIASDGEAGRSAGSSYPSPRGSTQPHSSRTPPPVLQPQVGAADLLSGSPQASPSGRSASGFKITLVGTAQREPSHLSHSTFLPGTPRSEAPEDLAAGTAGALLDKVAGRSLRPLSYLKISRAYGASGALAPAESDTSHASDTSSRRDTDTNGLDAADARDQRDGRRDGGVVLTEAAMWDDGSEADAGEDDGTEPDTKMYQGVKQRLAELDGRIQSLRRQGDTAATAADMLGRKQDQLRADLANAGDGDDEQYASVLEHASAMVHLKEVEASLFHKQADLLEEEAAACRSALQYAVSDWHLRRELKRLEARSAVLDARAHSKALEAQALDADVADATECITLARARDHRQSRVYAATLEQQSLAQFIDQQEERLKSAKQRAAESRAEAAQLAMGSRLAASRRLLSEKKNLCNKALYQSAFEMADAYEQAAKIAAQEQRCRLAALKARADALGQRAQELGGGSAILANERVAASHVPLDLLRSIARIGDETCDGIHSNLEELVGPGSDAIAVLRRRMDRIQLLVHLYQAAYDQGDYPVPGADSHASNTRADAGQQQQQPASDAAKRAAQVEALQAAVRDLDCACGFAADLRTLCVEASSAQAALFDARTDADAMIAQLPGRSVAAGQADVDPEVGALQRRLVGLEVEISLARDQLSGAIQVVDYRQAAAQLSDAQRELEHASNVARNAVGELESRLAVHRESLAMARSHLDTVIKEAKVFTAGGNLLQAAAADEAAQRLAKDVLAAEEALTALVHEAKLKRDEQQLAGAGAEELRHVAEGSAELVALLLRIVELQQEARAVSRRLYDCLGDTARHEQEAKSAQALSEEAKKQAESLQHDSLQCRTNLKFADADALLAEARQCRAKAHEHATAAAAAQQAASVASQQQRSLKRRQEQLLREIGLLHTAAGHLQDALSCMRDKHHLVRKLRDVEYQLGAGGASPGKGGGALAGSIAEKDVLQTQVAASTSTIEHHLASKASYVTAADNLHLAVDSLSRAGACCSQAESAMQDLMKGRLAAAVATGAETVPLLTSGYGGSEEGSAGPTTLTGGRLALVQRSMSEISTMQLKEVNASGSLIGTLQQQHAARQAHQAELRFRCLRASVSVLEAVAEAAERASEARAKQASLSDQAAGMVSSLAAKILEAEANADEAARLEASALAAELAGNDDDEDHLKMKLMTNALLQQAETYRGEAAALQGRIEELQQQECSASARADELEAALGRLQADHRYMLEALALTERIQQHRGQQAELRGQAQALSAEIAQLDREIRGMEAKTAQLRQQLTTASHAACSGDVANLMVVMQQMAAKAEAHRTQRQQQAAELEGKKADSERLGGEIRVMEEKTEHVLLASERQEQVRQASTRLAQLQADLSAAQASCAECGRVLEDLRQTTLHSAPLAPETGSGSEPREGSESNPSERQSQQLATTQAAITLAAQMMSTHEQRVEVLQAAVAAWEAAKQRHETVLRHQEQLMQQAEWRIRLSQYRDELQAAAAEHTAKAQRLRADVGKTDKSGRLALAYRQGREATDAVAHGRGGGASDLLGSIRSQAATIKTASDASHQHSQAEAEDALASRAAALAAEVGQQLDRAEALDELVQPMYEHLNLAADTAMSVARLQLACVEVCADQGGELATMHDALVAVRGFAGRIQELLESADRRGRAGHSMEAAAARGQAAAVQETLQQDLKTVRACRQRLAELDGRMRDARQELKLAEGRLSQVSRPAAVAQSVAEYAHHACELHHACGLRQRNMLRLLRSAAEAMSRAEASRREQKAAHDALELLTQMGRLEAAKAVEQAAGALERSVAEAEAERRLLDAQTVQETDEGTAESSGADLYQQLAGLSLKLLEHMAELDAHQQDHGRLREELEGLQRSQEGAGTLLVHRRGELEALGGQIETHKYEAQLLGKMGNTAQARVRHDAANMLTSQLAEIAEDVMKLEARCRALDDRHAMLSSLYAKSEARMGLLSQLVKLCSAAVSHLLDARDAHEAHAACMRDAAVAAVELSNRESVLAQAESRVTELRSSFANEQQQQQQATTDRAGAPPAGDAVDSLRHASLVQAEVLLAERQRACAEQDVRAARHRSAQADVALQSSQLRITKAQQRTEDAQGQLEGILAVLNRSDAMKISTAAVLSETGITSLSGDMQLQDATAPRNRQSDACSADESSGDPARRHGVLAAAQLHSVTLQALAEAASKFIQALEVISAAETTRGSALATAQKAGAARDSAVRQQAVVDRHRAAAEGAALAEHVSRVSERRVPPGLRHSAASSAHLLRMSGGAGGRKDASELAAQASAQEATATAVVELERLQHEAAYLEAAAAQEQKMVACLERQHELLRRASSSLMDMARFGVAAELKAGPCMATEEAAALLAACKQLSMQHAATLALGPALECCRQAEGLLHASLDCVHEARRMRAEALGRSLAALNPASGGSASTPVTSITPDSGAAFKTGGADSRTDNALGASGGLGSGPQFTTGRQRASLTAEGLLAEQKQLLNDEEVMLQQVQELDSTATQLLEESGAHTAAFEAQWGELQHPARVQRQQLDYGGEDAAPAETSPRAPRILTDGHSQPTTPSSLRLFAAEEQGQRSITFGDSLSRMLADVELLSLTPGVDGTQASNGDVPSAESPGEARPSSPPDAQHQGGRWQPVLPPREALALAQAPRPEGVAGVGNSRSANEGQAGREAPVTLSSRLTCLDMAPLRSEFSPPSPVDSPAWNERPSAGRGAPDIDADLVAMAAATVARAKAAAAALAMRSSPRPPERQPPSSEGQSHSIDAPAATVRVAERASGREEAPALALGGPASPERPFVPRPIDAPERPAADWRSARDFAVPADAVPSETNRPGEASSRRPLEGEASGSRAGPHATLLSVLASRGLPVPAVHGGQPGGAAASHGVDLLSSSLAASAVVGAVGHSGTSHARNTVEAFAGPLSDISSSMSLEPPGSSTTTEVGVPLAPGSRTSRRDPTAPSSISTFSRAPSSSAPSSAPSGPPSLAARTPVLPLSPPRIAPIAHDAQSSPLARLQPPSSQAAPVRPPAPPLARLPLPEDISPAAASALLSLWSAAALHYERLQHMHDGALQHFERQWQRCQAQLQMLQAEELKARADGRVAEADAVAAASAKWQQRISHLDAGVKRHSIDVVRSKALANRAVAMCERLQLVATAAELGQGGQTVPQEPGGSNVVAEAAAVLHRVVPRLPVSLRAGSGVTQSLDRLQGELVQQVAALHAAATGLQHQSQRLFAKASRRSGKLKVRVGASEDAAAHAASISKAQRCAEESAALGERAVELASHARTLQEVAERLSAEGTGCSQLLERLQRAAEVELAAQQALVQTVELLLCEGMQAALLGAAGDLPATSDQRDRSDPVADMERRMRAMGLAGDFDSLLRARHPAGACLSAARIHARQGEELAQEAARAVQAVKEQLEQRLAPFGRCMEEAAAALSAMAGQRIQQHEVLQKQVEGAALCVARARSKMLSQRAAGDVAAAEKYGHAGDGWAKQLEKLRRELMVAAAAAEDLGGRAQALGGLGSRLRPLQAALDGYLDQHLEAWASVAFAGRAHVR